MLGPMSAPEREHWSRGLGFTLAAVGSAVGLGNMWRFSYMTAEHGGAAFVLLYVLMTLLLGLPVMLAELTVGRGAGKSPILALAHYGGRKWRPLGGLFVFTGFVILSYYSVIAGWTLRYTVSGVLGGFPAPEKAEELFGQIASGWDAAAWHLGFMVLCTLVVARGVRAGIERASLLLMPVLGLMLLGLAVYAAVLPGSGAGYAYYFSGDLRGALDFDVVKDAAAQAFFSLSLGMGAILTYASYLSRRSDLPLEGARIAVSDFGVALLAGLVVFPLIFALGLQHDVGESTLGALFITLPTAFNKLGAAGAVIGVIFMLALSVAALTSAISLLEVVTASLVDVWNWRRAPAAWLCGGAIALVGVPSALSLNVLDAMDSVGGQFLLVLGGGLLAVFVGWIMKNPAAEAAGLRPRPALGVWVWLLRIVVPLILAVLAFYPGGLASESFAKLRALFTG